MLDRAHRLRHRDEFTAALRGGRRAGRGTLVVHLQLTGEPVPPRVGFIVSRAVGSAVVRNRVRRRLRHLVREHLADLPDGARLVVRALPAAATARWADLGADLAGALRSARRRLAGQSGGNHDPGRRRDNE
jgi:ribonuclease P protein component